MGWRYLIFTLGGLTLLLWALRFLVFPLYESPRFLISHGRVKEAVEVVRKVATYNGRETGLTAEALENAGAEAGGERQDTMIGREVLGKESKWNTKHVRALFATRKMAWSTSLLIALWGESFTYRKRFRDSSCSKALLVWPQRSTTASYLTCTS